MSVAAMTRRQRRLSIRKTATDDFLYETKWPKHERINKKDVTNEPGKCFLSSFSVTRRSAPFGLRLKNMIYAQRNGKQDARRPSPTFYSENVKEKKKQRKIRFFFLYKGGKRDNGRKPACITRLISACTQNTSFSHTVRVYKTRSEAWNSSTSFVDVLCSLLSSLFSLWLIENDTRWRLEKESERESRGTNEKKKMVFCEANRFPFRVR